MVNTTILRNSSPAYTVSTRWATSPTNIHAAGTGALLAKINPRTLLSDTVMFRHAYEGKEVKLSKWLQRERLDDGSPASVLLLCGERRFLIRHNEYGLTLFAADMRTILARWRPETKSLPLALVISRGMETFETEILTAFLFEEGKLRSAEGKPGGVALAVTGAMMGESVMQA
ncbi:hypothetical protein B0H19DRAFT_1151324 [Mycena capillaripes]|nr:hypothetical protein B0H19DRAFT_1151324 [Mycena capillaripes]